ncbi:hypothetical protein AgCh_030193 [Apium graveolens]
MYVSSSTGLLSIGTSSLYSSLWILDSGASHHMSPHWTSFVSFSDDSSLSIMTADGTPMSLRGVGFVVTPTVSLFDVYYISDLKLNLVLISQICESSYLDSFSSTTCCVMDPRSQKVIGKGRHVSQSRLQFLVSIGALGQLKAHDISNCSGCKLAKFVDLPFHNSVTYSLAPFDIVHSDVWGPAPTSTKGGSRYYVSFIDDFTGYTWIYLMKRRSNAFCRLLASDGTISQTSCTDTPQPNGVAERKHRHLVETTRSFLLSADVPSVLWGEALLTAVYVINRISTAQISGLSPFEKLYDEVPDYASLRVFGCTCFVLKPQVERSKLSAKSALYVFLGYDVTHKGYCCFDPVSGKLYVSRHVYFLEHIPFFSVPASSHHMTQEELIRIDPFDTNIEDASTTNSNTSVPEASTSQTPTFPPTSTSTSRTPTSPTSSPASITSQSSPEILDSPPTQSSTESSTPPPVRLSTRIRKSTQLPDFAYSSYSPYFASFVTSVHYLSEPASYREAVHDPLWQNAMVEELTALHQTHTWDLVPLPPGKHTIGCRWVYKIKTKADGSVERYKARLVARGYSQEYGLDYEETFAPVATMTTVRTLIAVSFIRKWKIFQMDVKNAFLYGDLHEEVYMTPPPGLPHQPGYVCRLRKSIYGLRQSSRCWFEKFSTVLYSLGFRPSNQDSALFVRSTSAGRILLSLYVDDMIITGDDCDGIESLKRELARCFAMKDLDLLRYFLGIEVASLPKGYLLCQSKYIADLLDRARLTDNKTVETPLEMNARYSSSDGLPLADPTLYRTIVDSLVYLTVTRPDIAHDVHIVSQFVTFPTIVHWAAVLRILSDADWAGDPQDQAEYRAMVSTTCEIVWLRRLLADLGVSLPSSTPLYCDNKSAIHIARNSVHEEAIKLNLKNTPTRNILKPQSPISLLKSFEDKSGGRVAIWNLSAVESAPRKKKKHRQQHIVNPS